MSQATDRRPPVPEECPTSPCAGGRVVALPRGLVLALALAFVLLAGAAATDAASPLLLVDRPVQEMVVESRRPQLDQAFLVLTHLGASTVAVPVALAVAALVWRRCSPLALSILAAVAVRPVLEVGFKAVIARSRPEIDPLVDISSASFPSGHVFTAVAVWGLLPTVVAVVGGRRRASRAVVAAVAVVVAVVAASRVYLGVHWLTDVLGGAVIGVLFLVAVDALFQRLHRHRECRAGSVLRRPGDHLTGTRPSGR